MSHLRSTSLAALLICVAVLTRPAASQDEDEERTGLGPPPLYDLIREGELEPAGHIRDGRLTIDRVEFELTDGDLYLLRVDDRPVIAVYLGDGFIRCYPPDGVEHQQLEKFLDDDDFLEEEFDRFVFWFSDDTGDRLASLADATTGRDLDDAGDLIENRRERLLEKQLWNPDGRLVIE